MIWDYQRSSTFTVVWDGLLTFERGEQARFIGRLTKPTTMEAVVVIALDGTVQEQPDHEPLETLYPLQGKVFTCEHRNGRTFLDVYQTIPNLFSFPDLAQHRAFLAIPEFWNFLEERSDWNDLLPRGSQVRELRSQRYQHPDIADDAWAIFRYTRLAGILAGDEVREINGSIFTKIEQLFRLRSRAQYGNKLKLHMLTLSNFEGRSYVLDELVHEGPMTLEHAAFAAYAVLDLTAHLANVVLQLGVKELNTSFTAVLGRESSDQADRNLRNAHPDLALTHFWLEQQTSWIAELRDARHEFAHRGAAQPVYGPNERLLAMNFNVPTAEVSPAYDVEQVVSGWFNRSEAFFLESLRLLAEFSEEAVKPFEVSPAQPPIQAPKPSSDLADTLRETLRLLFASEDAEPKRDEFLYARLEKNWRKIWPFAKFRAFLDEIDGLTMDQRHAVGYSSGGDATTATVKVILSVRGRSLPWFLKFEKKGAERAFLVKTPMTVPVNLESQTAIFDYNARQSGLETSHSCAEFRFTVTNKGPHTLRDVVVVIAHGDLESASAEVGTLDPGESKPVFASTTPELGRTLPPGGPYVFVTLISEPVHVRVVYTLEAALGDVWADVHRCTN